MGGVIGMLALQLAALAGAEVMLVTRQADKRALALSLGAHATAATEAEARALLPQGADLDLFGPHVAPWRPAFAAPDEMLVVYAGAHGRAPNGTGLDIDGPRLMP